MATLDGDMPGAEPAGRFRFNIDFLVLLIVCAFLSILFVLYFNRVFGSIVSYAIRTWTWHKYRVYIDITALQVSLLGGRIFFTGLRYHGSNETFLVQHGYITWRYWLRRVRDVDINVPDNPSEAASTNKDKNSTLPCRISVNLIGLEWFVYNRTPVYDSVLAGLTGDSTFATGKDEKDGGNSASRLRERISRASSDDISPTAEKEPGALGHQTSTEQDEPDRIPTIPARTRTDSSTNPSNDGTSEVPLLLQLFPIRLECEKAAVVMGNENTKAILIVKAEAITGDVDASKTETPDPYRQTFKIQFQRPVVEIRDNDDFKEDQETREAKARATAQDDEAQPKKSRFRHRQRKVLSSLRHLVPYWRKSVESFSTDSHPATGNAMSQIPGSRHWQGLSRYLNDRDQGEKAWWSSVEYAAVPTILDSPNATLIVYWDVVGKVAEPPRILKDANGHVSINGEEPPAWGMHFIIKGGTVNYGPWADRHRADLQRVFFPTLCKDAVPAEPLSPGSWRVPTQFKVFVEIVEAITVRVPVREESKNWRWRGKEPEIVPTKPTSKRKQRSRAKDKAHGETAQSRPAGWLELKVPSNATVTYTMDSYANSAGYGSFVNVDFPAMEIWSSVNHDLLARSGPQRISCDLSSPLGWNALRNWHFDISGDDLQLFILRDHMFLIVDLMNDWSSGPPAEYLVFTPFLYHLRLHARNLKIYLNVNDENIIDKATELTENTYLILGFPSLKVESTIPLDTYRPHKNSIPFDVRANGFNFSFQAPQWNTMASFIAGNELGHAEGVTITGSYEYNTTTSPANTDTLIIQLHGQSPQFYLYGFLVRYLMVLKEDYFGEHVHFKTLDEYQTQLQARQQASDGVVPAEPKHTKSNDFDVVLGVKVDDPRIILPTNIYAADRYVECELASLSVDLRFTDYYMDLELELSPLNLSLGNASVEPGSPEIATSNTQLFIDGLRLYGHRLFGLPPTAPTYFCNWDLSIGAISGEATADFLSAVAMGGAAFGFTFDDVENALVPYSSLVFHDVTFIRLAVQSVHIWIHVDEAAFLFSAGKIEVNSNDWANTHYSKRADISIPGLQLSWIDAESVNSHKSLRHRSPPSAEVYVRTDINLAIIGRKFHFSEQRKIQQELLRREDQRTHRAEFLFRPLEQIEFIPELVDPPAQCVPTPPPPITQVMDSDSSIYSSAPSRVSHRVSRPRSFLSISSSSSNGSIRRSRNLGTARNKRLSTTDVFHSSPRREFLEPSGRHSGLHSMKDEQLERESTQHSRVAFSSLYHAPYFSLDATLPELRETPHRSRELDEKEDGHADEFLYATVAAMEDLDPGIMSEEHAHSSILVEFPSGVTAVMNPAAVRHATSLLDALQPKHPEDVLDSIQISAITKIFDAQKQEHVTGEISDLLIRLPKASVRFFNSSMLDSPDPSQEEQDQYDLTISQLALMTRTTKTWEDKTKPETQMSKTSLHVRMRSAEVSASERLSSIQEPQAAVTAKIDNVRVNIGAKELTYLDVDIGAITASTVSGKVEYLAALVHRTESVASDLGKYISETTKKQADRSRCLTRRLLEEGPSIIDPPFLIRPSTVLRSARKHIRTVDSWKMAMRLQQVWRSLDDNHRTQILKDLSGDFINTPPHTFNLVVAAFQKWRSWDLENPATAILLNKIFGHAATSGESISKNEAPLLGACRLGEMCLVLDPAGPKGNKIAFTDLNTRFDTKAAAEGNGLLGSRDFDGVLTTVNVCCADATIHLNWELCELVDDILRLRARVQPQQSSQVAAPLELPSASPAVSQTAIHVVAEIIRGSIETETINLKSRTLGDGLKGSFLTCGAADGMKLMSLMFNCKAVTSRVHSHAQLLGMMRINEPSIFVSQGVPEPKQRAISVMNMTASSQGLNIDVQQDIIVLMEVLDLLVRDEVAQLHRLQGHLPSSPAEEKGSSKSGDWLSNSRVNLAMFLDCYSISIPLAQPLTYKISGVVARASCAMKFGREILFDFDIKENSHEMQVNVNNERRRISLLQIPPTNGHITSHSQNSNHVLTVLTSMERVRLDASSVYSLLAALNRPQVSSAIKEIQQQSQIIQGHLTDIFGSDKAPKPSEKEGSKLSIVYNLQTTFGGLEILAKTSLKSELEPTARVLFSLDKVYLQSSNRHDPRGPILSYPEVHLKLNQIGLDIQRGKHDSMRSCGSLSASVTISANSTTGKDGKEDWSFSFRSDDLDVNLSPETVSTVVDVLGYLGDKIKDLDTSRELEYLRKLRQSKPRIMLNDNEEVSQDSDILDSVLSSVMYRFELRNIQVTWDVSNEPDEQCGNIEDMVLSINLIEFGTRTKNSARLLIEDFQLQTVPPGQDRSIRSLHSALLPKIIFNIGYVSGADFRRMAFQAIGESLDLRLTSGFIVPVAYVIKSISLSMKNVQQASAQWNTSKAPVEKVESTPQPRQQQSLFGNKRLESLLIDADFAGAVVYISGKRGVNEGLTGRSSLGGKYGQFFADDSGSAAILRSPGLAWKAEYQDNGHEDPSLYGEIKVDASNNILYPSVVPLVLEIVSSVKEVVADDAADEQTRTPDTPNPKQENGKPIDEDNILTADPSAVLGRLKLNLGLRICRQEFSLSCQPIARVAATMRFESIYFTVNTVHSQELGNFFAISGTFTKPEASVQHVYSRESTGSFEIDKITLSFLNSKHVSGTSGVSAILNISPMKLSINAKQVQDFLLFREIWYPKELRQGTTAPVAKIVTETSQGHLVQRYQQVAATAAFPWTATISIAALDVSVDFGQAIGRSVFEITDLWVSSKKTSDWEQNLCLGFSKMGMDCTGRLSGSVAMQDFKLRTSIQWPRREEALNETPLVQASMIFHAFRVKAAFDYQAFLIADITTLEFLMYNVREGREGSGDRLVAMFDGDAVQVFGTTTSAAQAVALYQAFQKLMQEKKESFESSLREIEKFKKRRSSTNKAHTQLLTRKPKLPEDDTLAKSPISLDTDVVVTLKALNLGVFPSTFSDHQVLKMEALNAYARFAASVEQRRIHSILRMTLGQLRIGLAGVRDAEAPKILSEISVADVVQRATGSRGGTILRVPRVAATMETWQKPNSNHIDYIFKSAFEGKVEVGWNYSRISFIRGMWANHTKSLEQIWGHELPMTAVKITGVPEAEGESLDGQQQKITAEVNVPQSKFEYQALEPPVIETPQLRDMGEATPPLEWIGLHRDRLPNLTHQIVIVTLLELAGEVEDAYSRILGA